MKGNALRWETQIELIGKEVEKWLTELNVKIKDITSRYSSQIDKTSSTIDPSQIKELLEKERDKIDQKIVSEKKKVIEGISSLFKTPERHMEEMLKRNKLYSRDETLKSKNIEDIFPNFEKHFQFLKEEAGKFIDMVDNLTEKYEELKARAKQIDIEAMEDLENLELELKSKLEDRDAQLDQYRKEKEETLNKLKELRNNIEEEYNKVVQIIQNKKQNCVNEKNDLINWSVTDKDSELFSKPIQWVYMPLYAMFVEDEEMMEERMNAVFPGYLDQEGSSVYAPLDKVIEALNNIVNDRIEDDMKIRSNFEFSCENKNFLEDPNLSKKIQKGISQLKNRNLINEDMEVKIRERLKILA